MNTIRLCFTATVAFLVVVIGSRVASCDYNIVTSWKCCPLDQLYDPEVRYCRQVGTDVKKYQQRLVDRLGYGFRMAYNDLLNMAYPPPHCNATEVLVDVPTVEMRRLMEAHPSPIELPPDYCFDLTPSDELVALTCKPPDQYCSRPGYTCVNKCCIAGLMYVTDHKTDKIMCEKSEKPFTLCAYETAASGSPGGPSNNTVLPHSASLSCPTLHKESYRFMLTTDGKLHINTDYGEWIIPETEYCVEYHAEDGPPETAELKAHVCSNAKPPPHGFAFWVIFTASVVCLVLTLIVYAILPYLRNAHGYYVMFYMSCQLMFFVCVMIILTVKHDLDSPLCIPFVTPNTILSKNFSLIFLLYLPALLKTIGNFDLPNVPTIFTFPWYKILLKKIEAVLLPPNGYFSLFSTLTTCCWLNVICFDIYWTLRYNNSTNRNTSKSVRTIMYHIYCWGFSSICVSTGYFFQHSHNETLQKLAPDIGKNTCFLKEYKRYGTFIFYLIPSCGTLAVNLILFLLTAIHCLRIRSELNNFRQTDSITKRFLVYKERFVMSIKLFLVFGIPFLFWMLCQLFYVESIILLEIIDIIYYLQGVYIFIIFVAKTKVIKEIRKKLRRSTVQIELTPLNNITGSS